MKNIKSNIIWKNGNAFFEIDGTFYEPLMFRSFRPTPANISLFHRNGVRLYQMLVSGLITGMDTPYSLFGPVWIDKGEYDFAAFDRQIEMFRKFAPDSYYCIFIQLDMPYKWLENHPEYESSFEHLECGMFNEEWKQDAVEYVTALINYAEEKYGECIFAYAFCAGRSCEWFAGPEREYKRGNAEFAGPFLKECKRKGITAFDYPTKWSNMWEHKEQPLYKANSAEANLLDFGARHVEALVCYFASKIQETLKHQKPLGTFFGYHCLRRNGNMAYLNEKAYDCRDVDIIFSPAEYDEFRALDSASGYQLAVNSLKLHNKLYLHEVDHRTHLAKYPMEHAVSGRSNQYRLVGGMINDCYETEYEGIMVLRRELAMAMLNGSAMWWFDFFGNYYASPGYEEELRRAKHVMHTVYQSQIERKSVAQIALIIDNRNFMYMREGSSFKCDLIRRNLLNLGKAGIPFDIFNAQDMSLIDFSGYKLVVFMDAFSMDDTMKKIVKEKMNGVTRLWLYAPNYIQDGKECPKGMEEVTGMKVVPFHTEQEEPVRMQTECFGFTDIISELFEVTGDVEVLGTYCSNGKTAIARKDDHIYSCVGNLSSGAWRNIAKLAGASVYTDGNGAFVMNSQFVCYQNAQSEECVLTFDRDYEFEELFDGGTYKTENGILKYRTEKGRTKLFLINNYDR